MKHIFIITGFVLFSAFIAIVIYLKELAGVNILEGISWPRFTSTDKRTDARAEEINIITVKTYKTPSIILDTPKTYNSSNKSKFERMVKSAVERIFPQVGFRTVRPSFNMGKKGRPLELDIYSHCLRLSIEAHGRQHYEFVQKYHKTPDDLLAQQERDRMTRENMKQADVRHIEVPYTYTKEDDVIVYVLSCLSGFEAVFYCDESCDHCVDEREDRQK